MKGLGTVSFVPLSVLGATIVQLVDCKLLIAWLPVQSSPGVHCCVLEQDTLFLLHTKFWLNPDSCPKLTEKIVDQDARPQTNK